MPGEQNQVKWRGVRPIAGIDGIWPVADATRVNEDGLQSGAATALIYTVPASKKLFITSSFLSTALASNNPGNSKFFVRDAGDVLAYYISIHVCIIAGQIADGQSFSPGLEAAAGYDVCVSCSRADMDAWAFFFGWLEDA